jgi:HK97 family phage major capsid protein
MYPKKSPLAIELKHAFGGDDDNMPAELKAALGELQTSIGGRIEKVEKALAADAERKSALDSHLADLEKRILTGGSGAASGESAMTPEQKSALDAGIRALLRGDQQKADALLAKASTKSAVANNDPSGGFLVLPQFGPELIRIISDISPLAQLARTVVLDEGMSYEEVIDNGQAGALWAGETDARNETTSPPLQKIRVELNEIYAQPKATQSLVDAASYDVTAWLQGKVGEAFAVSESAAFHNGTGIAQPRGFLTLPVSTAGDRTRPFGTIQVVNSGQSGGFPAASSSVNSADCLQDVIAALRVPYRSNAAWLMNRATAGVVSKLKDATTGRWLWQDSLVQGEPPTLLGYRCLLSEDMPDLGAGSLSIAFGDWRKFYLILRKSGIRFLSDPYSEKPYIKLYSYSRVGGGVCDSNAVKLLRFQ